MIATHGIIKKTQKTPRKEIKRAEDIRIQYLKENNK
ncbi:MAG: type II toxin-antitoxin system RelE/ParE family toxin [Prevotella sp.]|nr:type II toxin-antitoxin system RelE/ParE family toxin [Prevotella sp.]MCI7184556.1 type II toxin-antitoxin system RelE/ParE family toxin [Prevotella sp.]